MPLAEYGPLAGKNKTANGGFEVNYKTHDEVEDPWECWNSYYWAKFRPAYHYDSEVVHSGTYSLKIPRETGRMKRRGTGGSSRRFPVLERTRHIRFPHG